MFHCWKLTTLIRGQPCALLLARTVNKPQNEVKININSFLRHELNEPLISWWSKPRWGIIWIPQLVSPVWMIPTEQMSGSQGPAVWERGDAWSIINWCSCFTQLAHLEIGTPFSMSPFSSTKCHASDCSACFISPPNPVTQSYSRWMKRSSSFGWRWRLCLTPSKKK